MHPQHFTSQWMTVCNLGNWGKGGGNGSSPSTTHSLQWKWQPRIIWVLLAFSRYRNITPFYMPPDKFTFDSWHSIHCTCRKGNNKQLTPTCDKICCHGIHKLMCLYTSFLSPVKVVKEFLQCIGHATSTGQIAECTKLTTQCRDKYAIANVRH